MLQTSEVNDATLAMKPARRPAWKRLLLGLSSCLAAFGLLWFCAVQTRALGLHRFLFSYVLATWPSAGELSFALLVGGVGGVATALLGAALLQLPAPRFLRVLRESNTLAAHRWVWVVAALAVMGGLLLRWFITRSADFTDDERIYQYQAQVLLTGHFSLEPPPPLGAFMHQFVVAALDIRRWVGVFPLGQPILFAVASQLGIHWLFQPVAVLGVVWVTYRLGTRLLGDPRWALAASVITATSPVLLFVSATQHNSVVSCFLTNAALLAALAYRDSRRAPLALWAGLAIGLAFLVRPLDGTLAGLTVAAIWTHSFLRAPQRWRFALQVLAALACTLAVASVQLASNWAVSGSPLRTPYDNWIQTQWPQARLFGFGSSIWGVVQTPGSAVAKTVTAALRVSLWFAGSPVLFVWAAFAPILPSARKLLPLFGFGSLLILGYGLYMFPSVQDFGSVYHLPLLPTLSLSLVAVLRSLSGLWSAPRVLALCAASLLVSGIAFWWPTAQRIAWVADSIWLGYEAAQQEAAQRGRKLIVFGPIKEMTAPGWVFSPHFPSPQMDEPVLWTREVPAMYPAIRKHYPDRVLMKVTWISGKPQFTEITSGAQ